MSVRVRIDDDGRGCVERVESRPFPTSRFPDGEMDVAEPIAQAESIPDIVTAIWELFLNDRITCDEREQLFDEVEAEVGYTIRDAS